MCVCVCVCRVQVVTVTSTTTTGKELSAEGLAKVTEACDMALALDDDKKVVGVLYTYIHTRQTHTHTQGH